jgi:hypothetical protein
MESFPEGIDIKLDVDTLSQEEQFSLEDSIIEFCKEAVVGITEPLFTRKNSVSIITVGRCSFVCDHSGRYKTYGFVYDDDQYEESLWCSDGEETLVYRVQGRSPNAKPMSMNSFDHRKNTLRNALALMNRFSSELV